MLRYISDEEIAETLVRHYSLHGDGVLVQGGSAEALSQLPRQLGRVKFTDPLPTAEKQDFWDGPYFNRLEEEPTIDQLPSTTPADCANPVDFVDKVLEGDSTCLLQRIPDNSISRAITSPPYFNAREYSQWSNFYTYLYDMRQNAKEVYRTLMPGGLYVFNVFDYFDNEKTVNFSLMGKKRLTLAAHMSQVFERIGFEIAGVVPWDKGAIQGKRGFNGGNPSPYYQSPFNCWEHILVFRKPGEWHGRAFPVEKLNRILEVSPVHKMIRGVNTHGHSAPFPTALPAYFLDGLSSEDSVLDPYAGSGTTALACVRANVRFTMMEQDPDYARLARRRIEATTNDLFGGHDPL